MQACSSRKQRQYMILILYTVMRALPLLSAGACLQLLCAGRCSWPPELQLPLPLPQALTCTQTTMVKSFCGQKASAESLHHCVKVLPLATKSKTMEGLVFATSFRHHISPDIPQTPLGNMAEFVSTQQHAPAEVMRISTDSKVKISCGRCSPSDLPSETCCAACVALAFASWHVIRDRVWLR